ncbi:MAG: hypothetical protein KAR32_08465, partial [Candidatus Omnitrophica bacterium]|nr:hypothetical protein [Candidatus Omnitrophota bacterium]
MKRLKFDRKSLSLIAAIGFCIFVAVPAYGATTYYVRTDGGSATQCTGLADAPYSGTGIGQNCAFNHSNWAIAPQGNNPTVMEGGDTLIIDNSDNAEYMMGYGTPNTRDTTKCHSSWPWDCYMRPIPSGPDPANPTRILGKGWDSGCENPPQLWATERVRRLINLTGSDNIEIQCLELTDHSNCQEHGPVSCNRSTYPYGDWGNTGIYATDSDNVFLKNINIHGMAYRGIHAGRLRDWTAEDLRIVANPFIGWDGDVGAYNSSNSGTIAFTRLQIQYSGCGETYPGEMPHSCYSQSQGGYGDGLGTHKTGGNWIFIESDISHNTSDGLDLLYHTADGSIAIKRSRFEGNAGNQVKVAGNVEISNSVLIGNCGYFRDQSFTETPGFDNCRAAGSTLAAKFYADSDISIYNSTLTGNGDTMVISSGTECNGAENFTTRNTIFLGGTEFNDGVDKSALYWAAGATGDGDGPCGSILFEDDYSVIWRTKHGDRDCEGKENSICADPQFVEPLVKYYTGDEYDVNLKPTSPAIGKALTLVGKSSLDYLGQDRGEIWDIGAIEYDTAESDPTCAEDIQYCLTERECTDANHYWYDGLCNVDFKPEPTCVDGLQYCLTQVECLSQPYFWYDDACHAESKSLPTCADGIQYCSTSTDCNSNGYYWYNNTCNLVEEPATIPDPEPEPEPTCALDGIAYCLTSTDCSS